MELPVPETSPLEESEKRISFVVTRKENLRFVRPYRSHIHKFVKQRQFGCSVKEAYQMDFPRRSVEEYCQLVENGDVLLNGAKTTPDAVLKNGDSLDIHFTSFEFPVLHEPIQCLYDDENFMAVCKPPSFPVHSVRNYYHNTVLEQVRYLWNVDALKVVHRLDRLTSGVLMFAKTSDGARRISEAFRTRAVHKEYVALVDGCFPIERETCRTRIDTRVFEGRYRCVEDDEDPSNGLECETIFERIHYDEENDQSLVRCSPETGRIHQIRLHLLHLGHPIINDPQYNSRHHGEWMEYPISDTLSLSPSSSFFPMDRSRRTEARDDWRIMGGIEKDDSDGTGSKVELDVVDSVKDVLHVKSELGEWKKDDLDKEPFFLCLHAHQLRWEDLEVTSNLPFWAINRSL